MRKYEIAAELAKKCGYTSYLEICTSGTGWTFGRVDRERFTRCKRLMYRIPKRNFTDGAPIDFPTREESSETMFLEILRSGERFDIVFVDPWHTYECSMRDLVFGRQLVNPNGTLLVHDCNPTNQTCTDPKFRPGEWCGVTFAAYLDMVLFAEGTPYVTVDTDYGCGIMSEHPVITPLLSRCTNAELIAQWPKLGLKEKYPFFEQHRAELLQLMPLEKFQLLLG